ncbi:uncharacterized protein MELLADRAFT_114800 [Melampsora larici-populina 98AG31]|uniref:Uncharacterized protein n=1 Tax=Melampsora larici-populina (strain 98AG31 / pathotype 3-4-7) TaxID=747676 RepID=F4R3A7_MELLP|nr:uncharacterized protein MELLADRAFT_114800 [Melampsora larici-populina 98AG31]EGG12597.1 hypothetical protein MELLADRAFT_114800 [Melampsora larici-populina 98AG31]
MDAPITLNETQDGFHCLQITPNTKISTCVAKAINHLKQVESAPLCLHTIPSNYKTIEKVISSSKKNPMYNSVGKLISIVEIIKREYIAEMINQSSGTTIDKSHPSRNYLYQYNQYGSLESYQLENPCSDPGKISERHDLIIKEFLDEERKRPRQTHTPYMKIYLACTPIMSLKDKPDIFQQESSSSQNSTISTSQPAEIPTQALVSSEVPAV